MPYIKKVDRSKFTDKAQKLGELADSAGELNYAITVILHSYLNKKGLNYANCNELMGMMSCCSSEFYRKIVAPYEDKKIAENGDVDMIYDDRL